MANSTDTDNGTTCEMYRRQVIKTSPYRILSFLAPADEQAWEERSILWNLGFKIFIGIFAFLFLFIGIHVVLLIIRRECVRLKTKTFFAVYTCIAILCFSRFLALVLDPFGILGFISNHFDRWIIISRLLAALGFPSLVASYTMVFLTLLKIANASIQKQWYQKWKYVIPLAVVPYGVAVFGELIALVAPYPALISILVCEALFTLWGAAISLTYLFAGIRLLRTVNKQQRRTMRRSLNLQVHNMEYIERREVFINEEYQRRRKGTQGTTRKIAIITYATAIFGMLYSFASAVKLILLSLFVYDSCFGFTGERGNSVAWLIMTIVLTTLEIPLIVNMIYSITDVKAVVTTMKRFLNCQCSAQEDQECGKERAPNQLTATGSQASMSTCVLADSRLDLHTQVNGDTVQPLMSGNQLDSEPEQPLSTAHQPECTEAIVQVEMSTVQEPSDSEPDEEEEEGEQMAAKAYMLDAQGNSETSIDVSAESEETVTENRAEETECSDKATQTDSPRQKPLPKPRKNRKPHHMQQMNSNTEKLGGKFARQFTV